MKESFIYLLKKELLAILLFVLGMVGFSLAWVFGERTEISVTLAVISLCLFVVGISILMDIIQMRKIRKKYIFDFDYINSSKHIYEFFALLDYCFKYGIEDPIDISYFESDDYYYCYLDVNLLKISFIMGDIRKVNQGVLLQFSNKKDLKRFHDYLMNLLERGEENQVAGFNYINFEEEVN